MKSNRVTLKDIADACGCSANTVSRALRNDSRLSAATRTLIREAADRMGYIPNTMASSLRSGRTKTLAMIVGSVLNPFYSILCDLIQREAVRLGYSLFILCSNDDPEYETRLVNMAISRQVDGVLITPCSFESPALVLLRNSGIPFVLLSRSACAEPLHHFLGIPSTVRASIMFYNTDEDIDRFVNVLKSINTVPDYSDANRSLFEEVLMDHKVSPGHRFKMIKPTNKHRGVNPSCGDDIFLQLNVDDDGVITGHF